MKIMGNILLTLALLACLACDDVKEYPWNDAWNGTEQEAPEDSEGTDDTQTPEDSENPETPEDPETPADPQEPANPENPEETPVPGTPSDPEEPSEPQDPVDPDEPGDQDDPADQEPSGRPVPQGWTDVSAAYGTLPSYLRILKSPSELLGHKAVAYVAEADMSQAQWDVWSVKIQDNGGNLTEATDDSYKTPSQVYADGSWPVVINGGYFYSQGGMNYTASLAVSGSEALAYNIGYEYEGNDMRYPTRGVFRQSTDDVFDACWTYTILNRTTYMYPSPSEDMTKLPSATFPTAAQDLAAKTAIGGGPVLIDNGEVVNTFRQEMFSGIGPETAQPRTAIGVTSDGFLYLFVCEGRQMTEGVHGYTTGEVAEILHGFGCVEAMNLDGGGSSCMLVNGKETIKVSDGSQRAVASTVMIK